MNKEEVRHFKLYTSRTQVTSDRKDLLLFDYIRKIGDSYEEDRIFEKLYGEGTKNPFYRLKNRLLSDLNKSLILQHVDDDDNIYMFHLLSLARYYRTKNSYPVAFHYIKKAEKKAIQLENYELLDFIYTELIRLSHEIVSINPEEYIQRRKDNREKLKIHREIDDILAAVIYRLNTSLSLNSFDNPVFDVLQKSIDDYSENETIKQNPKLRFTIYRAVTQIFLSRHDYSNLRDYLLKTYQEFTQEGLFSKSNHDSKLQMLTYIVNTSFHCKNLDESLDFCEKLKTAMDEYNGLLYQKYLPFYYNGLIINYGQKDLSKQIEVLELVLREGTFSHLPFYEAVFYTNLSAAYFLSEEYKKALRTLVKVYIHDGYGTAGESLKLQIGVYELMLRLKINEFETIQKSIEKVRKDFALLLEEEGNAKEKALIDLIDSMNKSVDYHQDKEVIKAGKVFLNFNKGTPGSDDAFIDYFNWVRKELRLS
ncbi:MAG: hypothetical protein H6581_29285 [Bacteroidia bacterium]|nr:hypothetical protein [Bacteroidia bacterium]